MSLCLTAWSINAVDSMYKCLQLVPCDCRNTSLFVPAAAALLTSSGCSHPQGMEDSPVLFRSKRERGGGETDSETDIYRESGRK